tara:strand:- start:301 stop:564 length:264 start_codon:yes stop_codon:yes gene_type:complete
MRIGKVLLVRCKECGKEMEGHPSQTKCCGCPNMLTVTGDTFTAVDLNKVVLINSKIKKEKDKFSSHDLEWQEQRRKRKIRKLDFEIK